jgi:hypothetical protein
MTFDVIDLFLVTWACMEITYFWRTRTGVR